VFHAQVAADRGAFGIDEVAAGIADKLVRRHPHVFGDGDASTPEEVQANWDELKQQEKPHRTGPFDGVPAALPALMLADELQRKAGKQGFAWGSRDEVVAKVREELDEVLDADAEDVGDEVGDLLQAVVSLARVLDVDAEAALRGATGRFRSRFERMLSRLQAAGRDPASLQPAEWRAMWDEVKAAGW
jgi:MazG family protein